MHPADDIDAPHRPDFDTRDREGHDVCAHCAIPGCDGSCKPQPRARRRDGVVLRGYSRAFPLKGVSKRYLLDKIPARLWVSVRARAKREGISMRALILQLLTDWVERPTS